MKSKNDVYIKEVMKNKEWEKVPSSRQIICTGGGMPLIGFEMAFSALQAELCLEDYPSYVITSEKIWKMMKKWGCGTAKNIVKDDPNDPKEVELLRKSKNGVGYSIWGANIYVEKKMPENILIIGSKNPKEFSRIEIVE